MIREAHDHTLTYIRHTHALQRALQEHDVSVAALIRRRERLLTAVLANRPPLPHAGGDLEKPYRLPRELYCCMLFHLSR